MIYIYVYIFISDMYKSKIMRNSSDGDHIKNAGDDNN